jgi:hypothetical protein
MYSFPIKRGEKKMKRYFSLIILFIFLLGCVGNQSADISQHQLMAEKEGEFSLFVVADKQVTIDLNSLDKQGIYNVHKIIETDSLKDSQRKYKFLGLEKSPTFVVFDYKQVLFKTSEYDKLIEYLKKNQEKG